ncbi:conserved hypothetical protein [uncultured Desulfobacterium sp.]|uniref:Antitoxin n=1 Tax=uncultured Desulfobacterium sp. TaxID=201089 RepID=A0A445MTI4_9BACT|nr:conserved hypothetical protein [uncultured Desulfobacterium sp.]
MIQRRVGIREAKVQLSKLIKLVKSGQEIILTDRGNPVGKIVQVEKDALPLSERIRLLEEQGIIAPANKKIKKIPIPIPVADNLTQKMLQEDRNHVR